MTPYFDRMRRSVLRITIVAILFSSYAVASGLLELWFGFNIGFSSDILIVAAAAIPAFMLLYLISRFVIDVVDPPHRS